MAFCPMLIFRISKNNNRIPTLAKVCSKESAGRLITDHRQN